jgi:hypothetical protein
MAQQTAGPANAALPTEKVIVTAPKQVREAVIRDFIKSYAAPSPMIGKIARADLPGCGRPAAGIHQADDPADKADRHHGWGARGRYPNISAQDLAGLGMSAGIGHGNSLQNVSDST